MYRNHSSQTLVITMSKNSRLNKDKSMIPLSKVWIKLKDKYFFLDVPGRTEKPFLTIDILVGVRRQGKIALAIASSEIAVTFLTISKVCATIFYFLIHLNSNESLICAVSRNNDNAKVFQDY